MTQHRWVGNNAESAFVQLFGKESLVKMLDVFLRKHSTPLSKSDVADLADVHESTVGRNIDELVEMGIIVEVRMEGKEQYRLNLDSELVQTLGTFHTNLIEYENKIESALDRPTSEQIIATVAEEIAPRGDAEKDVANQPKLEDETVNNAVKQALSNV